MQSKKYAGTSHIPLMPMVTLLTMEFDALVDLVKVVVSKSKQATHLQKDNKASTAAMGKVIAAMKKKFNEECKGITFVDFWKARTGADKVPNHAESCGNTFALYVDQFALISEKDYDANPNDALEKASSIARLCEFDMTRDEVLKAAEILKGNLKDGSKSTALQELIDSLKGPKQIDGETARKYVTEIFQSGQTIVIGALACIAAEIRYINDPAVRRLYGEHVAGILDACHGTAVAQRPANSTPPPATPEPAPAVPETPASEPTQETEPETATPESWARENIAVFPTMDEANQQAVLETLNQYVAETGAFPPDADALADWEPAQAAA